MTCIPSPVDLKLDPNDENLLIGIPFDPEPQDQSVGQQISTKKVFFGFHLNLVILYCIALNCLGTKVKDPVGEGRHN